MFIPALAIETSSYRSFFKQLSQCFAISTAFFLPLSTATLEFSLLATVLFSLLASEWNEHYNRLRTNRVALMFVVFFSVLLIGVSYSAAPLSVAAHTLLKYSKFLFGFFLFSVFLNEKTARYAVLAFLLAASLTLLLSLTKFFVGWDALHRFGSDSGVFKDHIFTGFLMAFTGYYYGLMAFTTKRWRWAFVLLLIVAGFDVLYINIGRSGYLVFFSLLLLLGWQQRHWQGLAMAGVLSVFLFAATLLFTNNFKASFFNTQQEVEQYAHGNMDTSGGIRLNFYKNSLLLLQKHPWLGTGTGSFSQVYAQIANDHRADSNNPHNEYLNLGIQLGLVGIIVLLALFYTHWTQSFRLPPLQKELAQAVLVAIAVGSLVNSWLLDVTQGTFYVVFTALVFSRFAQGNRTISNVSTLPGERSNTRG